MSAGRGGAVQVPDRPRVVLLRKQADAARRFGVIGHVAPREKAWVDLLREASKGRLNFDFGELGRLLRALLDDGADPGRLRRYAARMGYDGWLDEIDGRQVPRNADAARLAAGHRSREPSRSDPGLFKLGWLADPSLLEARRKAIGVQHYVAEIAAWCAEINEQLDELAVRRGMPLVLMGGNAAALRLEVAMQRGSADNDYLTSASEQDIAGLMQDFAERFAAAGHAVAAPTT